MAYTTPPTFVSSTTATAADVNILGDDIVYLKAQTDQAVFSGFYANRSTNQSIPDSTDTDVTLTTESWDQGGWIAVSATTATVPASAIPAGYTNVIVDIRCAAHFAGSAVGARRLIINKSGTQFASQAIDAPGTSSLSVAFSTLIDAAAGDTFRIQVWQDSGGALNILSASLSVAVFKPLS